MVGEVTPQLSTLYNVFSPPGRDPHERTQEPRIQRLETILCFLVRHENMRLIHPGDVISVQVLGVIRDKVFA